MKSCIGLNKEAQFLINLTLKDEIVKKKKHIFINFSKAKNTTIRKIKIELDRKKIMEGEIATKYQFGKPSKKKNINIIGMKFKR